MTGIPGKYAEKLDDPSGRYNLQPRSIVEVFVEADEPYLTRNQVESRIENKYGRGFGKSTFTRQLGDLVDRDILENKEHKLGNIYCLQREKSDWPIPPDVDVEPAKNEPGVSEFFSRRPVKLVGSGVGAILFSTVLIWLSGALQIWGVELPFIELASLIVVGLLIILVGWGAVSIGAVNYIRFYYLE